MSDTINITTTVVEDIVEITTTDNQTIVNVINQTGGTVTKTSDLINDGEDGTSTYVEYADLAAASAHTLAQTLTQGGRDLDTFIDTDYTVQPSDRSKFREVLTGGSDITLTLDDSTWLPSDNVVGATFIFKNSNALDVTDKVILTKSPTTGWDVCGLGGLMNEIEIPAGYIAQITYAALGFSVVLLSAILPNSNTITGDLDLNDHKLKAGEIITQTNGPSKSMTLRSSNLSEEYVAEWQAKHYNGIADITDLATKADLVDGVVPASQLPAYVDDVLEYDNLSLFPATGSSGVIYMAKDTNKTYRWSGSTYVALDEGVALGETSSTAYRGDRGKTAYDHSQSSGNPHGTTAAQVGAYTTSQVDALLAGMVKIIAKNVSNPSVTGTTTETIFESYLVPGGTLSSVSTLQAFYRYRKTGTAGNSSIRIYINTTNSLSGATLIAFNSNGANLWVTLERTFSLSGGNLYGYPFGSTAISDVIGAGIALSSMSLNPANNFYIIITGQLSNSADTITLDLFKATN